LKAELALPLASQNHLAGVLLLGEKRSGERFTRRELELLETIGHHLATLFENIRLYEKTLQDEYMTMVSTIISNLVHELHNPLTSVKTMVGMLETRANHPEFVKRFMEIVPAEITRVLDITQKLVLYALPVMQEKPEMLRVSELAEKALALMKDKLKESQVAVTTTFADLPEIRGEAKQLIQMFLNLILNACQASKLGGRIDLFCGRSDTWPDAIVIRVKDAGAGIKTLDLPHLFKPFFSTKIYGLGLGLSICKKIVESHKGMIALESREGQGTTVTVTLPVHT
jgi:signal transduction histidine kinase